jgi:hypothetical protein
VGTGRGGVFAPLDNLHKFLGDLASLLGGVSNRLANAPRDVSTRLSEETASDVVLEREHDILHWTLWRDIDNNFS